MPLALALTARSHWEGEDRQVTVRLVLADDHDVLREGLCALLRGEGGYEIVGQAANGRECIELVKKLRPDVVVMDVTMPELSGIEAARRVTQEVAGTKIVALSIHSDERFVTQMLAAGADAYVPKACPFDELLRAIDTVMRGSTYVSTKVTVEKDCTGSQPPPGDGGGPALTPHEREVLRRPPGGATVSGTEASPKADRRRHRRAEVCLPVRLMGADRSVIGPGMTANVSPGGLLLARVQENGLREGQGVRVVFGPPTCDGAWERGFAGRVCRMESGQSAPLAVELEEAPLFLQAPELIGRSTEILRIKSQLPDLARSDLNVLIQGESGTGKNVAAELMHRCSERSDQPLVRVNCPSIPDTLFESQLFGHKKGAFTDAKSAAPGLFRIANHGTILLDEISAVPAFAQGKLLQAIDEKRFIPVGSCRTVEVDVRIVALTNDNLEKRVREGTFRQDLFYRLTEATVTVPPLRERGDDIPLLADYFLRKYSAEFGRTYRPFAEGQLRSLCDHPWPGNVRELENTVKRGVVMGQFVTPVRAILEPWPDCPPSAGLGAAQVGGLEEARAEVERAAIAQALAACDNCKTRAAARLGISYRTLLRKIKQYDLKA